MSTQPTLANPSAGALGTLGRRVLVVGTYYVPDSMETHVVEALRDMGASAEFFPARPGFAGIDSTAQKVASTFIRVAFREPERTFERRLIRAVARFAPSLVLVIQGNQVSPKTIRGLRSHTGAPIVCWCQDAMTTFGRQFMIGAEYDAVFVKDRYVHELFGRMIRSTVFHYLPEACNPKVHRTLTLSPRQQLYFGCDVMIAGRLYYYRQEILRLLEEFDVKMWGSVPDWLVYRLRQPHMRRAVYCDAKARAARAARVALNPMHYAEVDGLNCRSFELAGCGAFQLCTQKPVLKEHFIPGVEVETFESAEEMVEKIRHYLKNPEEADRIARRGQARAHQEHTYVHRLREIMRKVDGRASHVGTPNGIGTVHATRE
jgi:spore maturation protein CgeB